MRSLFLAVAAYGLLALPAQAAVVVGQGPTAPSDAPVATSGAPPVPAVVGLCRDCAASPMSWAAAAVGVVGAAGLRKRGKRAPA